MLAVILDADTMGADIDFSPITDICKTHIYNSTSPEKIRERIENADIVILNKVELREENLRFAKKLSLICVFAVGYNNIDINYCRARGISVRNVPGYCTESVSQHTFALLFSLIENMRYYDDFVKMGKYSESGTANHIGKPFYEIAGKKWGIIGMGAIGRRVAEIASCFGAKVIYCSISGVSREEKYENIPFDKLLSESDIISVHAPLNEKTAGLIGEKEFELMKKSAVFINVGRGAITDEKALADAVIKGRIAGAAIDVYSEEPPEISSPLMLCQSEKIVFTPHIAWASVEARKKCVEMTAENIMAFKKGDSLHDVCNS